MNDALYNSMLEIEPVFDYQTIFELFIEKNYCKSNVMMCGM